MVIVCVILQSLMFDLHGTTNNSIPIWIFNQHKKSVQPTHIRWRSRSMLVQEMGTICIEKCVLLQKINSHAISVIYDVGIIECCPEIITLNKRYKHMRLYSFLELF